MEQNNKRLIPTIPGNYDSNFNSYLGETVNFKVNYQAQDRPHWF